MFGYVVVNKPELKIKDYDVYQSFYCGLCDALKRRHGFWGRITLNYDMTMLVILLSSLYEPETREKKGRCIVHPLGKHLMRENEFSDYAADMNVLLAYYKAADDVRDENKLSSRILVALLKSKAERIKRNYGEKSAIIESSLKDLTDKEKEGEDNLDALSGCFGHIMEAVFVCRDDEWSSDLGRMGFFLGKYIYLLDAYDDLEGDVKKSCFNPFAAKQDKENFHIYTEEILEMMMAEAARSFEVLPLVEYADILRNIIYGGVWQGFLRAKSRTQKGKGIRNS